MINVLGFQLHLELNERDMPDLIRQGWLVRDPHPKADVIQVRFSSKGRAEITAFNDAVFGAAIAVGFQDSTGRRWIIGTVKGPVTAAAPVAVHLPLYSFSLSRSTSSATIQHRLRSGARRRCRLMLILIVEDEFLIGLALQMVLLLGGHRVIGLAGTADEALRLAEAAPPELAFVDINIRGDTDGIAVARALTQQHGTSCIFLTAQADQARNAKDVALGVISKPYHPPELLRAAKVVAAILKGETLATPPGHLELFR